MQKFDIKFGAGETMTPDVAAKLAHEASKFSCKVYLKADNIELCVDSLIGIMAMNMRKGGPVTVITDGSDESEAGQCICSLLQGIA